MTESYEADLYNFFNMPPVFDVANFSGKFLPLELWYNTSVLQDRAEKTVWCMHKINQDPYFWKQLAKMSSVEC